MHHAVQLQTGQKIANQMQPAIGNNTQVQKTYNNAMSNVYFYIIANAEKDAELRRKVLTYIDEQGIKTPNAVEAPYTLAKAIQNKGQEGLKDLAKLHPDRQLIINQYLLENGLVKDSDVNNACGCSNATGDNFFNAVDDTKSKTELSTANKLIWGGVIVITFGIIASLSMDKK